MTRDWLPYHDIQPRPTWRWLLAILLAWLATVVLIGFGIYVGAA